MLSATFKVSLIVLTVLWVIKEVVVPLGAAAMLSRVYMDLVIKCDEAMEASWYFRQSDIASQQSDQVQLLACHDYDKTRKVLLASGLPEAYLSWLGLKSLEINQRSPEQYVEQHRFQYR